MPVMTSRCTTCPFNPDGDPHTRQTVLNRILEASQICHHPALHDKPETHLCRGARDVQLELMHRLKVIPEPTDTAWAEKWKEIGDA